MKQRILRSRASSGEGSRRGSSVTLGHTVASVVAVLSAVAVLAPAAQAAPGLPRTYDVTQVDSPAPQPGGAFGWGVASGDFTGDGKHDLLVAQSQTSSPSGVFVFDGVTGAPLDTIRPPELNEPSNPPNPNADNPDPTLAFVYVERMSDIGSCPGGDGADDDEICDAATVGAPDGIPEIITGSRSLKVDANPLDGDGSARDGNDPRLGRAYVFDGKTRAVLKRIDMPVADRIQQAQLRATPQFGRVTVSPQGMAPCAGLASEVNDAGVGPCPETPLSERIGDLNGDDQPDILITARSYRETTGPTGTSAPGSQCARVTSPTACTAGRAWAYSGAIAGTPTAEILDQALYTVKDPKAQTGGAEFGGNLTRTGDVGSCVGDSNGDGVCDGPSGNTSGTGGGPDGVPDFVIAARNLSYPLDDPTPGLDSVGAGFLFDGKTGKLINTLFHPEPRPRSQFTGSFNSGLAAGDLGAATLPDFVLGAPLQNVNTTDDGRSYVFRGDPNSAGGGGEGGFQFATLDDPTPNLGGGFGGSSSGVGDLVADAPANELLMGGWGPFDPLTQASENMITDVHFFNPVTERVLQTIVDPRAEPGSGFGIGMTPMGDLNADGFLDFAVSAYLADGELAGQGRAFIFRSNNSPAPSPPPTQAPPAQQGPAATPTPAPELLKPGRCANRRLGTNRGERIRGTVAGDELFGFGGDDLIQGFQSPDCIDGGLGNDRLDGDNGNDRLLGRRGNDRMRGRDGNDRLFGGSGRDVLFGNRGADVLAGGPGHDKLRGGHDRDRLFGEGGNDGIKTGPGRNRVDAGAGNDRINSRNGRRDRVVCGSGRDRVRADRFDNVMPDCERVRRTRRSRGR